MKSIYLPNEKSSAALSVAVTVAHGDDTMDETPMLSKAFLVVIPQFTLASFNWQPANKIIIVPWSVAETVQATMANKPPHITYYNFLES